MIYYFHISLNLGPSEFSGIRGEKDFCRFKQFVLKVIDFEVAQKFWVKKSCSKILSQNDKLNDR